MYDLGRYYCNTWNAKSGECKWYKTNGCYMTNDEILEQERVSEFDFNIAQPLYSLEKVWKGSRGASVS